MKIIRSLSIDNITDRTTGKKYSFLTVRVGDLNDFLAGKKIVFEQTQIDLLSHSDDYINQKLDKLIGPGRAYTSLATIQEDQIEYNLNPGEK